MRSKRRIAFEYLKLNFWFDLFWCLPVHYMSREDEVKVMQVPLNTINFLTCMQALRLLRQWN